MNVADTEHDRITERENERKGDLKPVRERERERERGIDRIFKIKSDSCIITL